MKRWISIAAAIALGACSAAAQDEGEDARDDGSRAYESEGQITANGQRVRYSVLAGETFMAGDDGEPYASIFSTAYIRQGVDDRESRPVAFIFNGGPGSASLWLHMGVFGPYRVDLPSDARDDGAAPYSIIENDLSIIDQADLVFVDPVGTGWSRPLGEETGDRFWGIREDARVLGAFIRRWLTENRRWNSPKYLLGESYGTTRIAALLNEMQGGWTDVSFNGVGLISTVLDFRYDDTSQGNDVGYIGLMPGFAATAWYHERVDRAAWDGDLEAFLADARDFAYDTYMPALLRGASLPEDERSAVAAELSSYIGLSESYLMRANLRVNLQRFMREVLREEGLSVGRLDSRFTGMEADAVSEGPEYDPSAYGIDGGYTAAMLHYFTDTLGVDITDEYSVIDGPTFGGWNRDHGQGEAYINVGPWVATAMRQNSDLEVLVAQGYYDLATPFFAAELMFNQPGFDPGRVTFGYYEAGHMMYIHHPSLEAFVEDVRELIGSE
ncbi:S10 family peptidase [Hyphobacterium sp.]|uniref:S10 family peptidase n=1 Tax=Hyphobacterium sp. TaxID=2004662 RepID=UPI003B515C88